MLSPFRAIQGVIAILGLFIALACAAPATPTATAPAASPAVPAASTSASAEWENVVAAAKREGKVVAAAYLGDPYRDATMSFQKAYPGIQVEYTGFPAGQWATKAIAEREGGQYLWDIFMGGSTTAMTVLRPRGMIDPIKPVLMLPEVLDSSKWMGGLEEPFLDKERQLIFGFGAGFVPTVLVNRGVVPEAELNSIEQLVDPKWKGKIATRDVRTPGGANGAISAMYAVKGEAWLRKFLAQDLVILNDERAVLESVIRGRYPIMLLVAVALFSDFRAPETAVLLDNVKPVDLHGPAGAIMDTGSGNIMLVNRAPHPNAAKVFINWVLSREGQKTYVDYLNLGTRRLDVEGKNPYKHRPDVTYVNTVKEEFLPQVARATEIAKEVIK